MKFETINQQELMEIEGGNIFDIYREGVEFVNNRLPDLIEGIKDGWNRRFFTFCSKLQWEGENENNKKNRAHLSRATCSGFYLCAHLYK